MKIAGTGVRHFLLLLLLLSLPACMSTRRWDEQESWAKKDDGSFPYHPIVYHLDLSILAYQLHAQSLVWPFDPYYEKLGKRRSEYMKKVHYWARQEATAQAGRNGLDSYRGPGVLGGFPNNSRHEPVIYRYAGLYPWTDAVASLNDEWLELKTPEEITGRIREAYIGYRPRPEAAVAFERIDPRPEDVEGGSRDILVAFEGGTGDKGDLGQSPSQSIMGFVLVRTHPGDASRYDVHIVFRGSRSGELRFNETNWGGGFLSWLVGKKASGNPDWITDLGHNKAEFSSISTTGKVHRGFATAMEFILPTLVSCLDQVQKLRPDAPPHSIYVTGHSLGGALAQHFVSAVLLGDWYGPSGEGPAMPASLRGWPWMQIKLITYGSPRTGDKKFARRLTESGLQSNFFSHWIYSKDRRALPPADETIVPRLNDSSRPAGFRVLSSRDPVTTEKFIGGKHVGTTVYVDKPTNLFSLNTDNHKPSLIRRQLLETYADPRIPPSPVWHGREMTELYPHYNVEERGTDAAIEDVAAAVKRYYTDNGILFDHAAFDRALELRFAIEDPK